MTSPTVRLAQLRSLAAGLTPIPGPVYTALVYTCNVKNVTLSAEDRLLERARALARERSTTLNRMFREWLTDLTADRSRRGRYQELMRPLLGQSSDSTANRPACPILSHSARARSWSAGATGRPRGRCSTFFRASASHFGSARATHALRERKGRGEAAPPISPLDFGGSGRIRRTVDR